MANIFGIAKKGFGMLGKNKIAKTISSLKPFSKTGGKTVEQVKQIAAESKLDAAKFNFKETSKKSDLALDKLKKTVDKLKKIKHYYPPKDF
tara:strand:+ start:168 stop:440 length:273 start_codon:yes stop_codon:yes gene_type:complete